MAKNKTIIDSSINKIDFGLKELIEYKDLFLALAIRDFKVRYAQTFLGILWALFQPLMTLGIFVIVFDKAIGVNTNGIPYPLFVLSGMCAWNYFSFVVTQSGNSLIGSQSLISKIYFPRIIIPLSKAVVGFIDFVIVFILLVILMAYYGYELQPSLIYLPLFILIIIFSSLTIGIWLSALSIRYRDFQTLIPFIVQFGLYATPVGYSINMITGWYKYLFYLNPMTSVIQGFRWCILGIETPDSLTFISLLMTTLLFVTGWLYFRRVERIMADII